MVAVRTGLAVSLAALVALLWSLSVLVGLGGAGWGVGLACGIVLAAAVTRGLAPPGARPLGPADVVTLTRATLACALAALVVDPSLPPPAGTVIVALAVVALLLDAVDGPVARVTRTVAAFGARFDGEADAFLILVLSVHVAGSHGWWVLAIGAARYVFWAAGRPWPWLRRQLPPRYWRKVVTATQGITLTAAATGVVPEPAMSTALFVALVLLAESFGRDVLWARRHRNDVTPEATRLARMPAR